MNWYADMAVYWVQVEISFLHLSVSWWCNSKWPAVPNQDYPVHITSVSFYKMHWILGYLNNIL